MKIKITGHVIGPKGQIEGTVEFPDDEAQRLIDLKVAEAVIEQAPKEKAYKNMNIQEQTSKINATESLEELELLREGTKATALPILEERIKTLSAGDE